MEEETNNAPLQRRKLLLLSEPLGYFKNKKRSAAAWRVHGPLSGSHRHRHIFSMLLQSLPFPVTHPRGKIPLPPQPYRLDLDSP
ncbi:unnamed protein product [Sphenostylis stenocarpa]|uniref:Uncharacterized protein n=1 Tax=Sphenostylis stenocarpa TaxID=92480 RepID=A0AA86SJH1_9FABA|nr:unnamed protein product [Sphenostylis stenocarpa]